MKLEDKIVHGIISGTIAMHYLEELKHTEFYSQSRKNLLNRLLKELKEKELMFDGLDSKLPDEVAHVYNLFYDFIAVVKPTEIPETGELIEIIKAYRKSPKSILGIANKING